MKIELLPWLRDYFVDMSEVYTEFNLEQGPVLNYVGHDKNSQVFLRNLVTSVY